MLQSLLEERFQMRMHHELKEFSAYNPIVAKGGLKLKDSVDVTRQSRQTGIARNTSQADCTVPGIFTQGPGSSCGRLAFDGRVLFGKAAPMSGLANTLPMATSGTPVIDKTGLTDSYDIRIEIAPNYAGAPEDSPLPSVFTALENDLGLKLESTKAPFDVVVVDHIDSTPTEN